MTETTSEYFPKLDDIVSLAKAKLDKKIFDYVEGGSGLEITVNNNQAAFKKIQFIPRVMQVIDSINLQTSILNSEIQLPIIIGPTAFHKLLHPEGEIAMANAAKQSGSMMVVSTLSTIKIEDIATTNSNLWLQIYIYKDREITKELIKRAEVSCYQAIVITVDTPQMGYRQRDVANNFKLPVELMAANFADSPFANLSKEITGSSIAQYTNDYFDTSFTWNDIKEIKKFSKLPIILKGIMHPQDAQLAIDYGIDAIIVSNHGGRQLDECAATIDILPAIIKQVSNKIPVLIDGGIKSGNDVIKCIALGADAVLIGRLALWSLALSGANGVSQMFKLLAEDMYRSMRFLGCKNIADLKQNGKALLFFS